MLGEDHSLINEFPSYKEKIIALSSTNAEFGNDAKRYHELDKEIRTLELDNAPIGDEALHKLKQEHAILKDALYCQLLKA